MIEIKRYTQENRPEWDEFVKRCKNATFLHLRNYMDYHSDRFKDFSLMAFNERGKLIAVLPANFVDHTMYSHQGLTYGGWLTLAKHFSVNTMMDLFESMADFLRKNEFTKLVYKTVPHIFHQYPAEEDMYALFRYDAKLVTVNISSVVDLTQPNLFSQSTKQRLKEAQKSNITVAETQDFKAFWKILDENLERKYGAKPVHTIEEIELLHSRFPKQIRLFGAFQNNQMIAGTVIFEIADTAHTQYISTKVEAEDNGALRLLFNELITKVYKNKRYFDFGTSNEDNGHYLNRNLIETKAGYGARGVAYNIFELNL